MFSCTLLVCFNTKSSFECVACDKVVRIHYLREPLAAVINAAGEKGLTEMHLYLTASIHEYSHLL